MIKAKFRFWAMVSVIIATIFASVILVTQREVGADLKANACYHDLIGTVFALSTLAGSTGTHPEERIREQWNAMYSKLGSLLERIRAHTSEETYPLHFTLDNYRDISTLFSSMWERPPGVDENTATALRQEASAQLLMKLRYMADDTQRLYELNLAAISARRARASWLVIGLIIAIIIANALIFRLAWLAVRRSTWAAEEAKRILDALMESIPEGIAITGGPPRFPIRLMSAYGRRLVSGAASSSSGGDGEATESRLLPFLLEADGRTQLSPERHPLARATTSGEIIRNEAYTLLALDGGKVPLLCNSGPVLDDSGKVAAGVLCWKDIQELKRAEEELRESEARYRGLFQEATQGIVLVDSHTGHILDCNRSFAQLSGYECDELSGRPWTMLHPGDDDSPPVFNPRAWHGGGRNRPPVLASLLTRSGAIKRVEIKANDLEVGERGIILAFYRDVTEESRYHQERETTLQLLRLLNDHNEIPELLRHLTGFLQRATRCEAVGIRLRMGDDFPYAETRGFPSEFVEAESSLCQKDEMGQTVRDFEGNPILECMCGNILRGRFNPALPFFTAKGSFWSNCTTELLASTTEADRQSRTRNRCNGEGYESVALIPLIHGTRRLGLLQLNDRVRGRFTPELLAFLENTADQVAIALAQRMSQTALKESERRFRDVSDAAGEFIWEMDTEGRLTYVSDRVETMLGYTPSDLVDHKVSEFMEPREAEHQRDIFRKHIETRTGFRQLEYSVLAATGEQVELSATAVPVLGPEGDVTGFRGVTLDITERKRAELDKKNLESQLAQAQRIEAVGRLAGGVAHDFNNMLGVILGYLDLAFTRIGTDADLAGDLEEIRKAARHSADLTRQLLAFARKQTVNPQVMDLNETVDGMINMLRRLIGEDITLVWHPGHDIGMVRIDPSQIDQVLANLAVNARDAIAGVGRLTIETANAVFDEAYCAAHAGFRPGEYVMLAVSDTGAGMTREVVEHIFEPFFTTKAMGHGTGLGLATVYGIVRQNDGFINVYSEPEHGTTIKIYLRRFVGEITERPADPAPGAPMEGTETILLVEDEESLLNLGRSMLQRLGYTVLAASTPTRALEIATQHTGDIHLLLTDVVMPHMNGRELEEAVSVLKPGIRSLFMSGYTANVIAHHGVLDEGVLFIAKPFTVKDIARKVREALDR